MASLKHDSIRGVHVFVDTLIQLNNAGTLFRAEVTRAVKNPGKGDRYHIIIGPSKPSRALPRDPWTDRGWCWPDKGRIMRHKIMIQSPTRDEPWQAYHSATVFTGKGQQHALHLLDILAQQLVVTEFNP